jgi:putative transposase
MAVSGFVELFCYDGYAQIAVHNLDYYRRKFGFRLLAYVIMPHHLHLVVQPSSKGNISEIMRDFKKHTAREIIERLEKEGRAEVLDVFCNAAARYHPNENRKYQVWEDRFDDVALYSEKVLRAKIDYIHNNPVRGGLADSPTEYLYSSARNYHFGDQSTIRVDCWGEPRLAGSGRGPDTHRESVSPVEVVG